MTYGQLMTYLTSKSREYGVRMDAPVLDERKDTIGLCMSEWCAKTRCMYRENIDFTTNGDLGPFSFDDTTLFKIGATPVAMVTIKQIFIDGKFVEEIGGINAASYGVMNTGSLVTQPYWRRVGEDQFQFLPKPTSTPILAVVSGPIQHKAINHTVWDDNTNLELPAKMHREFGDYCLAELLSLVPEGDTGDRFADLRARNDQIIASYRDAYDDHPTFRSVRRVDPIVSIGRIGY